MEHILPEETLLRNKEISRKFSSRFPYFFLGTGVVECGDHVGDGMKFGRLAVRATHLWEEEK